MASPQQYLNNPNVRKLLDVIASAEGVRHGYNTIFGNERFGNLSRHPNVRKQFKQTDGKINETTAAGRYQFLKDTWDGLSRQYGLKDFSPQSQDIGAIGLIMQKGALGDVLKGNYQAAIQKLGGTWASLPSSPYAQPKRSQAEINKLLGNVPQSPYQPKFVDLRSLGYKGKVEQQVQPKFIDLEKLGYQGEPQQEKSQQEKPQFVDLASLGYKGTGG